jgi:hypothetical protein
MQDGTRASLDMLPFTTSAQQNKVAADNSIVFEEYNDPATGQRAVCYGRIQSIIEHELYPGCHDTLRHVLIECDWYSPTNVTTASGLLQVSYDESMSRINRWTFLKDMHRANVVLWPAYSGTPAFAVIPRTFMVVEHTVTVRDGDEDYQDDVEDEDEDT